MIATLLCASACLYGAFGADVAVQPSAPSPSAEDLPLTVVSATPPALLRAPGDDPISLDARQPIQVVYSRAVVPLGSDFATPPAAQTPFTVSGGGAAAGTFRWLNSYVASFEPADEAAWGTDLALDFEWNTDLASFDGIQLSEAGALQVRGRCRRLHVSFGLPVCGSII